MTAAAVLTGARSLAAVGEWATDAPQPIRAAFGARRDAPDHWAVPAEATIRRILARLDPEALAAAIGAWLTGRAQVPAQPASRRRGGRQDAAGRQTPTRRPTGPPARRDGPRHPCGGCPAPGRRRAGRGPRVPAAAGRPGLGRHGGHRRCAADPPRRRRVPRRQAGPLPVLCQGHQPTSCSAAPSLPGIVFRSWTAPATRPTAASSSAPSRPSRCTPSGSPTPPRSSRPPASAVPCTPTPGGGRP
jgi:hypothetical protein